MEQKVNNYYWYQEDFRKTQDYIEYNQILFEAFIKTDSKDKQKDILSEMLEWNKPLFIYKLKVLRDKKDNKEFFLAEEEDILSIMYATYIDTIRKTAKKGLKEYPFTVAKIIENAVKTEINDKYFATTKVPYATKKRHARKVSDGIYTFPTRACPKFKNISEQNVTFFDDTLNTETFESNEHLMVNDLYMERFEQENARVFARAGLNAALNSIGLEDREIVLRRVLGNQQWADIGAIFGMTEGGARFRYTNAMKKLAVYCKEMELDICLA